MLKENLKAQRKAKGFTQEEIAIRLNVVRQTVSKWEKGQSVPDADMLIRAADILEVQVSELLGTEFESDKELSDIATQLSRINEQLAIINQRARRVWKSIAAACFAIVVISAFIFIFDAFDFNNTLPTQAFSPNDLQPKPTIDMGNGANGSEEDAAATGNDSTWFLNSVDGIAFQSVAFQAAKALLSADADELSLYMANPSDALNAIQGMSDISDELEYLILIWSNDQIKSEVQINASYRFLLKGEDSVSFVSLELVRIEDEWKVCSLWLEK